MNCFSFMAMRVSPSDQSKRFPSRTESTSEPCLQEHLVAMLPPQLETEIHGLRREYAVDAVEEASIIDVVLRDFPTSGLYSKPRTNLLIRVPRSYPDAGLDMFWTDYDLTLQGGGVPNGASVMELCPALDVIPDFKAKEWRRFSWHPQPGTPSRWNPSIDNLFSYIEFVRRRFSQP